MDDEEYLRVCGHWILIGIRGDIGRWKQEPKSDGVYTETAAAPKHYTFGHRHDKKIKPLVP